MNNGPRRAPSENATAAPAPAHYEIESEPCVDLLREAVDDEPGILDIDLDTESGVMSFGYVPELVAKPKLDKIAHELAPSLQHKLETCTLRVGQVGGRACEACALGLERRVSRMPGVRHASASYLGGVLRVTYDGALVSPNAIADRVKRYGVPVVPPSSEEELEEDEAAKPQTLVQRLAAWLTADHVAAVFTVVTLVATLLALVVEKSLGGAGEGIVVALYAVAYVAGGSFALKASIQALTQGTIDIDLLMVLAALGAAFVGSPLEGAILLFLFSLSNVLQSYAMDRTRSAIKALMKLRPKRASVRRGETTVVTPIERIVPGDCIVVKPGERVALDGVVSAGESTVDQSSITGESMPVGKSLGDSVFAGTINKNGSLDVTVTKLAKDSTLAQLIKMVEEAQSEKAQTQRFIDRFEQSYALAVIVITALAIVVPIFIFSEVFHSAFYRAMTIMVAMSPCALVISTPASILSGIANGARRGVLFKGGVHLEQAAMIKVVAFDKTGTLTEGKPKVTDVVVLDDDRRPTTDGQPIPLDGSNSPGRERSSVVGRRSSLKESDLLALAAAVQSKSEHALARATLAAAAQHNSLVSEAFAFQATTGKGVRGVVDGRDIRVGNLRYFDGLECVGREAAEREMLRLESEGKTSVVVGEAGENGKSATLLGVIAFADMLRPDVASVVRDIKAAGVERVVMLTGDNRHAAAAITRQAGLDDFYAELLPEDKVRVVREIGEKYGPVAMVGDGVNDAPALATARLGIAMGAAGTDVALETADVVLMGDDLSHIPYLIALSKQTRRTLVTNIGFAMFMILIMLLAIFSIQLPLPLAVVGHEGGTVLVSLNGLRLLGYRYRSVAAG